MPPVLPRFLPPSCPLFCPHDRARIRNASIRWQAMPGATGYDVRRGIRPDRPTLACQVFADRGATLELRALNVGQSYSVAVGASNETCVSPPSKVVALP